MDIGEVMDELAEALKTTVPKLRAFPYYAESVTPPAAIVGLPDEYTFDASMGRGSDHAAFPVYVLVGKVNARSARDNLAKYANGSGPGSVKAAIEAYEYTACDTPAVRSCEFGVFTSGGVEYLSATFVIDVHGTGE